MGDINIDYDKLTDLSGLDGLVGYMYLNIIDNPQMLPKEEYLGVNERQNSGYAYSGGFAKQGYPKRDSGYYSRLWLATSPMSFLYHRFYSNNPYGYLY